MVRATVARVYARERGGGRSQFLPDVAVCTRRGDEVYPRTFSTRDTPETVAASVILSDIALAKAENRSEQTKADENDGGPQIAGPKHVKRKRQRF
jgi:hypothetical protein